MFNNIGKKIKNVALVVAVIGMILSMIIGSVIMGVGIQGALEVDDSSVAIVPVFIGLLVVVIGSLISWLMSFLLYGYGELIDETSRIANHFCGENQSTGSIFGNKLEIPIRNKEINE